jgi:hypothetical protein
MVKTINDMGRSHIEFFTRPRCWTVSVAVLRTTPGESALRTGRYTKERQRQQLCKSCVPLNVLASDKKRIAMAHGDDS